MDAERIGVEGSGTQEMSARFVADFLVVFRVVGELNISVTPNAFALPYGISDLTQIPKAYL